MTFFYFRSDPNQFKPVLTGFHGDGRDESSCQTSVYCHIAHCRKMLTQRQKHDSHSRRGSGCGLYANVDQSPLSGRGHVTPLDQSGPYDAELSFSYYFARHVPPLKLSLPPYLLDSGAGAGLGSHLFAPFACLVTSSICFCRQTTK